MTSAPKGQGAETTAVYMKYDAWNRVTGIDLNNDGDFADAGEVGYAYDGLGRRIGKDFAAGGSADEETYYNDQWQAREVRRGTKTYTQTVWDEKYVDAPIVRFRHADDSTTTVGVVLTRRCRVRYRAADDLTATGTLDMEERALIITR